VNRGGHAQVVGLTEKVGWQLLQEYTAAAGVQGIAAHDLRRTCAKLCQSVHRTERYLGTKQDLLHAPNDEIKLRVAV
jgi:hypothetical protein